MPFVAQSLSTPPLSVGDVSTPGGCKRLNDLAKLMLGYKSGKETYLVPTHIASLGNASSDEPGTWVPILFDSTDVDSPWVIFLVLSFSSYILPSCMSVFSGGYLGGNEQELSAYV